MRSAGATEIIAIPVFLLAAGHVKKDIPFELRKAKRGNIRISKQCMVIHLAYQKHCIKAVYNGSGKLEQKIKKK